MKKLITTLLTLTMMAAMAVPALGADYRFSSGGADFGTSTPFDGNVAPDPMTTNERRNKDAAFLPPPPGFFSGDIPTNPSSPFHNNLPQSGFVPVNQDLPPIGNEGVNSNVPPAGDIASGGSPPGS